MHCIQRSALSNILVTRASISQNTWLMKNELYVLVHGVLWWCHQMETFSALLALCVGKSPITGEFPTQRPVTWSFDVFFDLRPNKQLSKHSRFWWFETPSRSLWRHSNEKLLRKPKLFSCTRIMDYTDTSSITCSYLLIHILKRMGALWLLMYWCCSTRPSVSTVLTNRWATPTLRLMHEKVIIYT